MEEDTGNGAGSVCAEFDQLALKLLDQSADELFDSYNCQLAKTSNDKIDSQRVALGLGAAIGFTGEFVRGVLAIALDDTLAKKMNPVAESDHSKPQHDWIGELANQLLGRLKNKLLGYSIELAMSTPVVIQGSHLKIGTVNRQSTHVRYAHEGSMFDVWWDAEVDPALLITEEDAPDVQLEGEMVLF